MNSQNVIGIVGLGYVGLPIALAFAKNYQTIAYDINLKRVKELTNRYDSNNEFKYKDFLKSKHITFTNDKNLLKKVKIFIVTVPTPVFKNKTVDKRYVISATKLIQNYMKKDSFIIYESTVYPGFCEEICLPILKKSKLVYNTDFFIGYSPERINPGDKKNKFETINKVVSGSNKYSTKVIANLYKSIINADVHIAKSIKVAEAAKVIENAQRDLNVAFMNEINKLFSKMDLNIYDILKAANTKWNFLNFEPGMVGGHCISVDPYYLMEKAKKINQNLELISTARKTNDNYYKFVSKRIRKITTSKKKSYPKVLILGYTFKENCTDTRNTGVKNLYLDLIKYFGNKVFIYDPLIKFKFDENFNFIKNINNHIKTFDVIILCVKHDNFLKLKIENYLKDEKSVIIDLKDFLPIENKLSI